MGGGAALWFGQLKSPELGRAGLNFLCGCKVPCLAQNLGDPRCVRREMIAFKDRPSVSGPGESDLVL